MKKGIIFYVTEGKDAVCDQEPPDLLAFRTTLGASAVSLATSEDEIAYAWWRLLAQGMHQVFCVTAAYDSRHRSLKPHGEPLRLSG